jgi:hypothetical protein
VPPVPWKETYIVDQRIGFTSAVKADPRGNFTRLCERFGISRQTGYALLARYAERGAEGLEDRAPRAQQCPHKTAGPIEDLVVEMRKKHPQAGPKKVIERLTRTHPAMAWPAASTVGEILKLRGLIRPRRTCIRAPIHPSPLEPCAEPNDVWCTDFKGHFELGDRTRCHPLTITDGASRYLIPCEGLTGETMRLARPHSRARVRGVWPHGALPASRSLLNRVDARFAMANQQVPDEQRSVVDFTFVAIDVAKAHRLPLQQVTHVERLAGHRDHSRVMDAPDLEVLAVRGLARRTQRTPRRLVD